MERRSAEQVASLETRLAGAAAWEGLVLLATEIAKQLIRLNGNLELMYETARDLEIDP